jgi:hypothetical protein
MAPNIKSINDSESKEHIISLGSVHLVRSLSLSDVCLVVEDLKYSLTCDIVAKKMKLKMDHLKRDFRSVVLTLPEVVLRKLKVRFTDKDQVKNLKCFSEEPIKVEKDLKIIFNVHLGLSQVLILLLMDAYIYLLIGSLFYHRLNYLVQHAKSFITYTVGNKEELIIFGIPS